MRSYIIFNYAIFFIDADGAVTLLNDNTRNNRNNIESSSTQLRKREREDFKLLINQKIMLKMKKTLNM